MKLTLFRLLAGFAIAAAILGPLVFGMSSCRSSKHSPPPAVASLSPELVNVDKPAAELPRRLFGLLPPKREISALPVSDIHVGNIPRKCKGCTIVYSAGPATVTTTTVGKKGQAAAGEGATASQKGDTKAKGGAVVAQDSSTTTALTGGGNLAHTIGDGNTTTQTKQDTTKEAAGTLATLVDNLTGPLGYVLAAAAVGGILFLIIRRRARKAAETLV